MKKKEGRGRPSVESVPKELLDAFLDYPFDNSPFQNEDGHYSEAKLREVVKTISDKIRDYILSNLSNQKTRTFVSQLIQPKFTSEKWKLFIRANNDSQNLFDAKTLKNCLEKKVTSAKTICILKAFIRVQHEEQTRKKYLRRIAGEYFVYMVHNSMPGKFQTSLLKISETGYALYTTQNRFYSIDKELELHPDVIGNSNLLLTLKEPNYLLTLYLYMGNEEEPNFLQAVYMYSNRTFQTIANLAVLERIPPERVKEVLDSFEPNRGKDIIRESDLNKKKVKDDPTITVGQNIQQYLLQKAKPIVPTGYQGLRLFDFSKHVAVYPGPYRQSALQYKKTSWLVDKYYIYFSERFASIDELAIKEKENQIFLKNRFFSTVQKALLEIKKEKASGVLVCTMRCRRDRYGNELIYKGYVLNHEMDDGSSLLLSLYLEPDRDRCLNLLLKIEENALVGCYQISYTSGSLGSGNIIARRCSADSDGKQKTSDEGWAEKQPQTLLPHQLKSQDPEERSIVNLLSQNGRSLMKPPGYGQWKRHKGTKYQGLYYKYSWRADETARISLLCIYSNGYVRHVGLTQRPGQPDVEHHAYGQLEQIEQALNILLVNESGKRAGFFSIRVNEEEPDPKNTCYAGTFAGMFSGEDKMPIAAQFLLDFIGQDKSLDQQLEFLIAGKVKTKNQQKAAEFFKQQSSHSWLEFNSPVFTWNDVTTQTRKRTQQNPKPIKKAKKQPNPTT